MLPNLLHARTHAHTDALPLTHTHLQRESLSSGSFLGTLSCPRCSSVSGMVSCVQQERSVMFMFFPLALSSAPPSLPR